MIIELAVPKLSANIDEVTVTAWLKRAGDAVAAGEPVAELTTSKAVFELESPGSGILRSILAARKSVVPVGYVVALIGAPGDNLPDVSERNSALMEKHRRSVEMRDIGPVEQPVVNRVRIRATPAARRLARELGIDPADIAARNPGIETITETVVRDHIAQSGADK